MFWLQNSCPSTVNIFKPSMLYCYHQLCNSRKHWTCVCGMQQTVDCQASSSGSNHLEFVVEEKDCSRRTGAKSTTLVSDSDRYCWKVSLLYQMFLSCCAWEKFVRWKHLWMHSIWTNHYVSKHELWEEKSSISLNRWMFLSTWAAYHNSLPSLPLWMFLLTYQ